MILLGKLLLLRANARCSFGHATILLITLQDSSGSFGLHSFTDGVSKPFKIPKNVVQNIDIILQLYLLMWCTSFHDAFLGSSVKVSNKTQAMQFRDDGFTLQMSLKTNVTEKMQLFETLTQNGSSQFGVTLHGKSLSIEILIVDSLNSIYVSCVFRFCFDKTVESRKVGSII